MLLRTLMFACVLLLLTGAARAQTQTPAPWPPENPQDLFGPEVEIISVEEKTFSEFWHIPVQFDAERQIARLEDGRILPFPFGFEGGPSEWYQTPIAIYLIETRYSDEPSRYWMIDLETGEWVRLQGWPDYFDTLCGPRSSGWNYVTGWLIITGRNDQRHACDVATGYLTPPLPTGFTNWRVHYQDDQPYVILYLSGVPDENQPEDIILFAFDVEAKDFIQIGPFKRGQSGIDEFFIGSFSSNPLRALLIAGIGNTEGGFDYHYAFVDVERKVLIPLPAGPYYHVNRKRLVMQISDETQPEPHCEQQWLMVDTLQWLSYQVPISCQAWVASSIDEAFFLIPNADNTLAEVIAVNAWTGERRSFFTGEIEAMRWVSADGRYAAFELDSDGAISQQTGNPPLNAQLKVIDMATEDTLFEAPAQDANGEPYYFTEVAPDLLAIWRTAETLLIRLDGEQSRVQAFQGSFRSQFGTEWLLFWTRDDLGTPFSETQASVVSLTDGRAITVADTRTWPMDYRLADVSYRSEGVFTAMIEYTASSEPIYMLYSLRVVGT